MNRFSPIDPASLPPLTLVEVPDKEAIIAARMTQVVEVWNSYDPPFAAQYDVENLEFDPIKIAMEVGTSFEINALTFVNKMGQATTLAEAFGDNLDAIGSSYPNGVPRLQVGVDIAGNPIMESDSRYRQRIWLSSNAFSTAGAGLAYVFEVLSFDGSLRDVTANMVRDGLGVEPTIVIVCLDGGSLVSDFGNDGEPFPYNPIPSDDRLLAIRERLLDPGVSPLSDVFSVVAADVMDVVYTIGLWLYPFADEEAALTAVRKALGCDEDGIPLPYIRGAEDANLKDRLTYLGVDHTMIEAYEACGQLGVQSADIKINGLSHDLLVDQLSVGLVSKFNLSILGRRE